MAISIYKNGPIEGLKTYVCDSSEDIKNLPTKNIVAGCIAYTVNDKKFYIVNSKGEWKEQVEVRHIGRSYDGDYTITPSEESIILPTKDRLMEQDLTVEANRTLENALIQHTPLDEYRNDEVTEVIGEYSFGRCMIKKLYLPNVTTFKNVNYCIDGANSSLIEEVHFPRWTTGIAYAFFDNNPNLRLIDYGFQGLTYMRKCPNLKTLILRRTTLINVGGSNAWTDTPLHPSGSGCYVYVPKALIEQYRTNANWQQYCNVLEFRPIEGSEYEIEGLESTNNLSQSFSLSSPLNDAFDEPLETLNTPLENESTPTEELESEE